MYSSSQDTVLYPPVRKDSQTFHNFTLFFVLVLFGYLHMPTTASAERFGLRSHVTLMA